MLIARYTVGAKSTSPVTSAKLFQDCNCLSEQLASRHRDCSVKRKLWFMNRINFLRHGINSIYAVYLDEAKLNSEELFVIRREDYRPVCMDHNYFLPLSKLCRIFLSLNLKVELLYFVILLIS